MPLDIFKKNQFPARTSGDTTEKCKNVFFSHFGKPLKILTSFLSGSCKVYDQSVPSEEVRPPPECVWRKWKPIVLRQ